MRATRCRLAGASFLSPWARAGAAAAAAAAGAVFAPFSPPVSLPEAEEAQVVALVAMGFERALALRAFIECGHNQEHAANYLLSGAI